MKGKVNVDGYGDIEFECGPTEMVDFLQAFEQSRTPTAPGPSGPRLPGPADGSASEQVIGSALDALMNDEGPTTKVDRSGSVEDLQARPAKEHAGAEETKRPEPHNKDQAASRALFKPNTEPPTRDASAPLRRHPKD